MDKPDVVQSVAGQVVAPLHSKLVFGNRVTTLARLLSQHIAGPGEGLDIGCGSGVISRLIMENTADVQMTGVDVLVRPETSIPVREFDGHKLPFPDDSFDFSIIVDVLHHTDDARVMLREARRVSRKFVLIKDHYCDSKFDQLTLSFMDWVGNRAYGVNLPYNYLSTTQWNNAFAECGLRKVEELDELHLYPAPFNLLFDRHLHFIAKLTRA